LFQFHRIDGTLVDVSDRDVEEIGLQYFNSIPKMEHNKSSKNYADLLVEDVGDNDALTDSKKFNDLGLNERYGNETDRSKNGENQPYLPPTQTEAFNSGNNGNGGNGCNPAQQSSQSRRSSPNPSRTSVSRVKSIFMETASSLLPILYSSSSTTTTPPVRTDYSSSVQHRVSTKNHVNLEEPNCDDSFLSGVSATKFLSPDENRLKTKNKELLKSLGQGQEKGQERGQDEHLPVQDSDRGNLNQPPEKWKQRRLSSTPTSPPPTNYKSSSNQCVDDYKPKNNQNREFENFHEYRNDGNKTRNSSSRFPNENEYGTIRYKRKTQTRSTNSDARDSDDNSSKSGSDDVMMKSGIIAHTPGPISGPNSGPISGPNSGHISGPNSSHISGPNSSHVSGPNSGHISGPNSSHISGPNSGHISGPNSSHISGPNSSHISGPNSGHISGPNSGHISGPNSGHISGPNSGHISGPNSSHISGPNSGNNQMPILVHPRQKSLTPLMDKVNSNYRDNYQRERGDINDKNNSSYIRNESETISDVINFESHKPHAPLGIREPQGENFRGLQMQKILSSVQNAQLQKEVDALQRQLAQLEELEGENITL
jgi:hypothetical protein